MPWTLPLALRHAIHRTALLHLLPRPDRIALLQQLGERGSRALGELVLQLLRKIGEGHVGMDRLDVA